MERRQRIVMAFWATSNCFNNDGGKPIEHDARCSETCLEAPPLRECRGQTGVPPMSPNDPNTSSDSSAHSQANRPWSFLCREKRTPVGAQWDTST